MRQVDNVLPARQSRGDFSRQLAVAEKIAMTTPAVQAIPEDMDTQPDSGYQDATAIAHVRIPETGSTELENVNTVYHTARQGKEGCREVPVARSTKKTRERKVLLYDSEESDDDDIPEQRHPQGKAETDAKAGETRHSSRHSNGTSKRAADPADAKVSSTTYAA